MFLLNLQTVLTSLMPMRVVRVCHLLFAQRFKAERARMEALREEHDVKARELAREKAQFEKEMENEREAFREAKQV